MGSDDKTEVILLRLEGLSDDVRELTRAVKGYNGTPGLIGRMAAVESCVSASRWVLKTLLGGVVAAIGIGIFRLFGGH